MFGREAYEQIDAQRDEPADEGHECTAEGEEVETPLRDDFFGNLARTSKPDQN